VFKFNVGFRVTELTPEERTRKNLTYQNAVHIKERCRSVQDVSPMLFTKSRFHQRPITKVTTCTTWICSAWKRRTPMAGRRISTSGGSSLTKKARRRAPVVVIGADVEQSLFANIDPVGKLVNVDGHQFEVIGTMQRPAASSSATRISASCCRIGPCRRCSPTRKRNAIVVTAREGRLPQALDEIVTVLRIDRHVPYNNPTILPSQPPNR